MVKKKKKKKKGGKSKREGENMKNLIGVHFGGASGQKLQWLNDL
jgi:hypothetical protein